MTYYIIAGEASGDLHGSNLIKELKKLNPNAQFRAWGGDLMEKQGATLVKHIKDLAFMGFWEVITNLKTILGNIKLCKEDILQHKPDCLILIDYPGFNMRIAEFAKANNIKVVYYISPQVWAWKANRAYKLKATVDKLITILPFEKDFFKKYGFDVEYVGHPLLDAIEDNYQIEPLSNREKIIALLPGSRKQEINTKLPLMLACAKNFPDYNFIVAGAPSQNALIYEGFLKDYPNVKLEFGNTYGILNKSQAALVTSGTATLETALLGVPEVVCYKASSISYTIARAVIKVPYISLVNLILNREAVKELIQHELTEQNISKELEKILKPGANRDKLLSDYIELKNLLGGIGASHRAATIINSIK